MTGMDQTGETWFEAEVNCIAGEIVKSEGDRLKAKKYFEQALVVSRRQQAKSWELRAAMSLARASGATRARCSKRANCWLRFTGGLRRVSTRAI